MAVHIRSSTGTLVLEALLPFTLYTILVEACTQFGCTRSPVVIVTTDESGEYVGQGDAARVVTFSSCRHA